MNDRCPPIVHPSMTVSRPHIPHPLPQLSFLPSISASMKPHLCGFEGISIAFECPPYSPLLHPLSRCLPVKSYLLPTSQRGDTAGYNGQGRALQCKSKPLVKLVAHSKFGADNRLMIGRISSCFVQDTDALFVELHIVTLEPQI